MMESGEAIKKESWVKRHRMLLTFVLGVAIGIAGTIVAPNLMRPYMPDAISDEDELLQGIVRGKRFERDRLLLTVPTTSGTILATFTEDVSEIDLLVLEGDSVTFSLSEYTPFVEDPEIARVVTVRRPQPDVPSEATRREAADDLPETQSEEPGGDLSEPPADTLMDRSQADTAEASIR